jgi:hypothetical protein
MFPTSTKPVTVLSWAAAAFFVFAAFRVLDTIFFAAGLTAETWQRRWIEFGILAGAALILALIAFFLPNRES